MSTQDSIQSQYLAVFEMLRQAVQKCPESLWDDASYKNLFSQTVSHVLFYTHFYLHNGPETFIPWSKHRPGSEGFDSECEKYSKADLLEYINLLCQLVGPLVNSLDLDAPSGFHWLPFSRLETHIYNIRHLQHHTGELYERLGSAGETELGWIIK
jgi:hypothetical protein